MVKEVEGRPAKTAIFTIPAISPKITKNWRNRYRSFCENLLSQVLEEIQVKGAQQKLRFLQFLLFLQKWQKIGEIAVFGKIN